MVSFWTLVVRLYGFAGPAVTLAYPLYASAVAIESPFKEDDTQWLTYWVLYSFIQLIELGFDYVVAWLPFWYTLKLAVVCWLVLPQFHGAAYIYNNYVKQHIGGGKQEAPEKLTRKQRELIERMSPTARTSLAAFIEEHGSPAFDTVIASASRQASRDGAKSSGDSNEHPIG